MDLQMQVFPLYNYSISHFRIVVCSGIILSSLNQIQNTESYSGLQIANHVIVGRLVLLNDFHLLNYNLSSVIIYSFPSTAKLSLLYSITQVIIQIKLK